MFQFLYNVISTIIYSICIIIGSLITGRQPKISLYHLEEGIDGIFSKNTWFNNDSPYRWISRNEDLKELNQLKLKAVVDRMLNNPNDSNWFKSLTEKEKLYASQAITDLVKSYRREIL